MSVDEHTRAAISEAVKLAVTEHLAHCPLSSDEISWVRLAIKSEVERSAFRRAVIEKTTLALIWSLIAAAATYALHFIQTHITFR